MPADAGKINELINALRRGRGLQHALYMAQQQAENVPEAGHGRNEGKMKMISRKMLLLAIAWVTGCSHTHGAERPASNETLEVCTSIILTPQGTIKAVLLPYNIPAGSIKPMGVPAPAYMGKQLSMGSGVPGFSYGGGKGFSLRQAISKMSTFSGISIDVRGSIPATRTKYWDEIPVPGIHGSNTFGHFLRAIISYMQEVGIPTPRNMVDYEHGSFRVVAILGSKKVEIDSFSCSPD